MLEWPKPTIVMWQFPHASVPVVQQTVIMPEESVLVNDPYEHTLEIANEIELFPGMLRTRICFIPLNFVIDLNSVIYLLSTLQQKAMILIQKKRNFANPPRNYIYQKPSGFWQTKFKDLKTKHKGMRPYWVYWASKKGIKNKSAIYVTEASLF